MHHQQGQRLPGDRDPADDEDGAQPHAPHHAARLRDAARRARAVCGDLAHRPDYRRRRRLIASIADQGKPRIAAFCRVVLERSKTRGPRSRFPPPPHWGRGLSDLWRSAFDLAADRLAQAHRRQARRFHLGGAGDAGEAVDGLAQAILRHRLDEVQPDHAPRRRRPSWRRSGRRRRGHRGSAWRNRSGAAPAGYRPRTCRRSRTAR